ncbi:single hybrid motif superfamily protein [Wolffia australiana]
MALRLWASSMSNALRLSRSAGAPLQGAVFCRHFAEIVLDGLKYSESHEWVKNEGGVATIGITDHAQGSLGEVVFVELSASEGGTISKGASFGDVESVKATSQIISPVSGEVLELNTKLSENPGLVNSGPYDEGWMIKVKLSDPSEVNSLFGPAEYTKFCEDADAAH